jgi:hypothetical protein
LQINVDVGFLLRVGGANRVGSSFGGFECVGDRQRNVLAVVANDIVRQWGAAFIRDAAVVWLKHRAENFSDVSPMKNRADARHFLGSSGVELLQLSVRNRRFDWYRIQ